jgi:hypothetical protein
VRLEASTKPHVHNLIHEFLINMAFTMACPNFKKGLKMAFGPLGVHFSFLNEFSTHFSEISSRQTQLRSKHIFIENSKKMKFQPKTGSEKPCF